MAQATEHLWGPDLRRRVAREILALGALSIAFLLLFPRRPILVDMGLAMFALGLVLLSAKYTKHEIWAGGPLEGEATRWPKCVAVTMIPTALVILLFLGVGITIAYRGAGWPGVFARILHPSIPIALVVYLAWALIQQALFQFYLLGRVRVLFPARPSFFHATVNGLVFGLVHMPNLWVALLTALGGTAWSYLYLRYRLLWPLALSHALAGTTFYYWVYGHDLTGEWRPILMSP